MFVFQEGFGVGAIDSLAGAIDWGLGLLIVGYNLKPEPCDNLFVLFKSMIVYLEA